MSDACRKISIGELCDAKVGGTPSRSEPLFYGGSINWVKSGEVCGTDIYHTEEKITNHAIENSSAKLLESDSVLLAMYGATAGQVARLKVQAATNQALLALTPKDENIDKNFLYYTLENSKNSFLDLCQGSGQPNLSSGLVKDFIILLPPLPEQKKIAEILSRIDKLLENVQKQISKLQNLQKGVMCDLLTRGIGHSEFKGSDLGPIPNTWEIGPLSEIADMISGFAFSSSNFLENGSLCIRMGNLYNNQFDQSRSPAYLPKDFIKEYPKFIVNPGDLLMSMTGTAGKRDYGFVVEVPWGFDQGLLNQRVAKILSKDSNSKKFICELMRSEFYLEKLFAFGSGTKQANLSVKQILGIVIPIPPIDEQVKIGEIISSIERNIYEKQQRFLHLQILKDSLMQDLLSGNRRVSI